MTDAKHLLVALGVLALGGIAPAALAQVTAPADPDATEAPEPDTIGPVEDPAVVDAGDQDDPGPLVGDIPDIVPGPVAPFDGDGDGDPRDGAVSGQSPPQVIRLRFAETLQAANDETANFRTEVGLSYAAETPLSDFRAEIATSYDYEPYGSEEFENRGINYTLSYRRQGVNATFSAAARARTEDLDEVRRLNQLTGERLIFDQGRLQRTTLSSDLALGLNSPLGLSLSADYTEQDYVDATDPQLNDSESVSLSAQGRVEVSPVLSIGPYYAYDETDEDGITAVDTLQESYGATFDARLSSILSASGRVFWREAESDGLLRSSSVDGLGAAATLTLARPLGSWSLSALTQPTTAGRRQDLVLGRVLEGPAYSLSSELGVSFAEDGDPALLLAAAFDREVADGTLTASASTNIDVVEVDQREINQSFGVGYTERVNRSLSFTVSANYDRSRNTTTDFEDEILSIGAEFDRQLTRDWTLTAGAEISSRLDETEDDREVFFTISRTFEIRP